ncbi:MAG: hypothetical protein F9K44_16200 [Hyphomicrobiaceae bacterium]|nr:MAG: hypothetical protein F9K44_16200 [Hyphomicrobiaceae bacterium]
MRLVASGIALSLVVAMLASAAAQQKNALKAAFIDGAYTIGTKGCAKLKAIERGGPKSLNTVPWTLDADGFHGWEGGCTFSKITEALKGKEWLIEAECAEAAEESKESYRLVRTSPTTFAITLTTPGTEAADRKPITYSRCNAKVRF